MENKGIRLDRGKLLPGSVILLFLLAGCAAGGDLVKSEPPNQLAGPRFSSPPATGSLWPGENTRNTLFADNKARQEDDIVTIVVSELTDGASKASTNTSRDASTTAGIAALLGLDKSLQQANENLKPKIEVGGSASNTLKGQGDTSRTSKLSARLTARVLKVMENGNLFIEGRRQLTMNGEEQCIVVSGIVRPEDITSDNLIASQFIADARIYYTGDGVINDKMQPGWLTQILDKVWPF